MSDETITTPAETPEAAAPKPAVETPLANIEEDDYEDAMRATKGVSALSLALKIAAIVILVLSLGIVIWPFVLEIQQLTEAGVTWNDVMTSNGLNWVSSYLMNLLAGIFYGLVLFGLAAGLDLLVDIYSEAE